MTGTEKMIDVPLSYISPCLAATEQQQRSVCSKVTDAFTVFTKFVGEEKVGTAIGK